MKVIPTWLDELPASQMATLSFNLVVLGWIIMEVTYSSAGGLALMPCSYLHANVINVIGMVAFVLGAAISLLAMSRGGILFAAISLSFVWNFACTLAREAGLLTGLPIH